MDGGGDCAQPFPLSSAEVGGPLSSYSSLSEAVVTAEKSVSDASPPPPSSSASSCGDGEAMALSPVSLDDDEDDGGGCARRGGDGGGGAEGGCGRSAFGGGSPCQVDDGGVGGRGGRGGGIRTMEMFCGGPAVVEMGAAVGPKEIAADGDDQERNGMMALSSGGCGGDGARRVAAVDGMVGVVERHAAVDTAPKA